MTLTKPKKAFLYCRISDSKNGTGTGVRDQEADLRRRAGELGWGVAGVVVENDTSAFKRRTVTLPNGERALRVVRPGWRSLLDDLASGRADGLIALDLDRAARDPRDLEDLIDVVEARRPRIPVESVTGSLKLASDSDITMARIMVAVANKSSRDTARRVTRARLRQAEAGAFGGGSRPFGFEADGVTPATCEADELRRAVDAVLAGAGLRSVVADLNARGVMAARGGRWTTQSLRGVLLAPRMAGLVQYQGSIIDGPTRAAIIDRDTWEAVGAVLNDPNRKTTPGPTPRWLGSGLFLCGHPEHAGEVVTLRSGTAGTKNYPVYRCSQAAHLVRTAGPLDEFVQAVIIERLSRPDAADLLAPASNVDAVVLAREANGLRARIAEAKDAWESGVLTLADMKVRTARMGDKLDAIEATLASAAGRSPLAGLAGNLDAATVWDGLDLGRRRAVLDVLLTVTVLPRDRRGRGFDPDSVRVTPRDAP